MTGAAPVMWIAKFTTIMLQNRDRPRVPTFNLQLRFRFWGFGCRLGRREDFRCSIFDFPGPGLEMSVGWFCAVDSGARSFRLFQGKAEAKSKCEQGQNIKKQPVHQVFAG